MIKNVRRHPGGEGHSGNWKNMHERIEKAVKKSENIKEQILTINTEFQKLINKYGSILFNARNYIMYDKEELKSVRELCEQGINKIEELRKIRRDNKNIEYVTRNYGLRLN